MYTRTRSAALTGITAYPIEIETHMERGLPGFQIVGLPDSAVRESRERVTAAIKNSSYDFPQKRITVNLAPADVRKEGSGFDLPIAIGVLSAAAEPEWEIPADMVILGELSLDGELRPIHGILSIAVAMKHCGIKSIVLPRQNADEAALVEGVSIYGMKTLSQVIAFLRKEMPMEAHSVDVAALLRRTYYAYPFDMSDVKGQAGVKRALEIAAAGGHNLIMVGPPGSGKTMIAKRLPSILPPLTMEEALETTKIHSVSGMLPAGQAMVTTRPYRAPHHTISDAALVGGGVGFVKAGEISLAHHGVLFLDELPEFARNVLEVLRQPLEDKRITISRTRMTVEYPANFMLVCSMNPCPCGNYGNPNAECTCTPMSVQKYMSRISGPLLDRIDLHIDVPAIKVSEMTGAATGEDSARMRDRVVAAREIQSKRYEGYRGIYKNADMGSKELERFCTTDMPARELLKQAMINLGLSARAYDRILKVSRTIADLTACDSITCEHIAEAIHYRNLDRPYWNG